MASETFTSLDGTYLVDWAAVGRMIRSYVRSRATLANTKVNEEFHWIGPTLHTLDVDWDKVKSQTDSESATLLAEFYRKAQFSTQSQIACLAHWVETTRKNNDEFHKKMQDAQKKSMANIDKSVGRAETGLRIARATRDASAEFLMVSATIVSGGAVAVGAVAVGSGLKATAKSQDDPAATKGAVAVTFASEFAFGLIDIAGGKVIDHYAERAAEEALLKAVGGEAAKKVAEEAAKKGTKLGLAILWNQVKGVTLEPAKAVIQGKTFQQGLVTGSLKSVGGTHGELLKYMVLADTTFPKLAAIADTAISLGMDGLAEAVSEPKEERGEKGGEAPRLAQPSHPEHLLLDALAYDRKMIEQTAIRRIGAPAHRIANPPTSFPKVKAAAGFRP